VRKLTKDMNGEVNLRVFRRPEDIDDFLRDATQVSKETYQWKSLGLGLKNQSGTKERLLNLAHFGFLRCYVLYCMGKPVAFVEGFSGGGEFVFYQIGFLPELRKNSVGTVAVLEALRDLMDSNCGIQKYDFMSGSDDYKKRMSNCSAEERSSYVYPPTIKYRLIAAAQWMLETLQRLAVYAKRRIGSK
jgi:CelD/BcsL family acetyltransferase involved in cellulose biosynthesis